MNLKLFASLIATLDNFNIIYYKKDKRYFKVLLKAKKHFFIYTYLSIYQIKSDSLQIGICLNATITH